ncbi:hypothetical protein P9112_002458 [Eukaryota sp. TZLM1-RC]
MRMCLFQELAMDSFFCCGLLRDINHIFSVFCPSQQSSFSDLSAKQMIHFRNLLFEFLVSRKWMVYLHR